MLDRFPEQAEGDLTCLVDQKNSRRIKQLLNAVIAKYRDLSVYRSSIIFREIIDLLATYKSRYFAITAFNNCYPIFGGHSISEQTAKAGSAGTPLKEINRI